MLQEDIGQLQTLAKLLAGTLTSLYMTAKCIFISFYQRQTHTLLQVSYIINPNDSNDWKLAVTVWLPVKRCDIETTASSWPLRFVFTQDSRGAATDAEYRRHRHATSARANQKLEEKMNVSLMRT